MSSLTNIFDNSQNLNAGDPDGDGDYHQILDYGRDIDYLIEKITEVARAMSANPSNAFHILYGGEITEHSAGSGTIDISAGVAIGKDADGNIRIITIPAITDQAPQVAYKNDLQIWVIGKHKWKLNTSTRTHKTEAVSYQYIIEDSYEGEFSYADMETQTDPNTPTETVVCWGSYKMSAANVFTALTGRTRLLNLTADTISEKTAATGVTIDGVKLKDSEVYTDKIVEKTAGAGVGIEEVNSAIVRMKVINIGDWNMDLSPSVSLFDPITDNTKIRNIEVVIRSDDGEFLDSLDRSGFWNIDIATTTELSLNRTSAGRFDSTDYNATSYNRGWITIWYVD